MRAPPFTILVLLSAGVAGGCGTKSDGMVAGGDSGGTPTGIEGTYVVTAFEMVGWNPPKPKDAPDELVTITKETVSQPTVTGKIAVRK